MRTSIIALSSAFIGFAAASPLQSVQERAVPAIAGWEYAGCFYEASASFIRALEDKTYIDDLMTNEKCATACAGFNFFGTEYGRECYCGKNFASSGPTVELECSADCPGDATQKCGGNRRLTTYAIPGILTPLEPLPYKSLGCYTESTTGRALAGGSTASDSMTVQKCAEYCIGFSMFGLEYSRECFCGYMLGAGSVKAPEAQCSNVCSGSAEICGGPSRLSVYTNNL